jgi:hypothetical protein
MAADHEAGQKEEGPVMLVVEFEAVGVYPSLKGLSLPAKAMIALPTVTVCFAITQVLLSLWKTM